MNNNLLSRIPPRYWGYFSFLIWGGLTLFLLRQDPFSLDEGAAKSLLLVWSVADQVASSVVTFGAPDFRVLLFAPVGFLWTGSIFAIKVFTTLTLALAAWQFFSWKQQTSDSESALWGTGLLVLSPAILIQIDTLSPGIFLLASFALGTWLNKTYRSNPAPFGGWYFAQLFVCALSVSLHPAGLAYPLALLWSWYKTPLDHKQQKYFFIGISFVVLATLLITMGWHNIEWLQNPFNNLASLLSEPALSHEMTITRWLSGSIILLTLAGICVSQYKIILSDFFGSMLAIGLALGATTFDTNWSMIALCILLYFGLPKLLHLRSHPNSGPILRNTPIFVVIVLSTLFMQADKAHYQIRQFGFLSDQDMLIKALSEEAENLRRISEESDGHIPLAHLRVASQWPSRTMIACRCDTLPLPPAAKSPQEQLTMLRSITHLIFNPRQPENIMLARNLAALGGDNIETVSLQPEGVLLHFKNSNTATEK